MFRILSLAGGGLRGAFAIGFLTELEKRIKGDLWDYFDLITGTSTGAITASALCRGTTAAEVQAFYEKHAAAIFHPRPQLTPRRAIAPLYPLARYFVRKRVGRNLDHFFGSRYCPQMLEASMVDGFGNDKLSDARHCRLIIPSVNLTDGVTCVIRTPHLPLPRKEYDWEIKDIILAATAAPTYFPHKTMADGKDYADGGLWAIDPGVVGLSEAARILRCHDGRCDVSDNGSPFDYGDVTILSLGTGRAAYSLAAPGSDAGMLFWSKHVADVMSISQVQGTQLPLQIVLGDRYQQFDFELRDPSWSMDNIEMTEELFRIGKTQGVEAFDSLAPKFFDAKTTPYEPAWPAQD
ncbi:MAG: patatin-like phospholipase family protein [Planctomycetota bacterium]